MKLVKKLICDLKQDPENLRHHGTENIEMIKSSLLEFEQYKPLIVDKKTGIVKIGNGRLQAMRELGWKECWCVEVDFKKHPGLEVIDNRLNELSQWEDPEIDDWLLNDKGVDWWGVDLQKSLDLLKAEKKRVSSQKKKADSLEQTSESPKPKETPLCPCCGKPLKKVKTVLL